MANRKRSPRAVPAFKSEAEERRFWETHDSAEYVDWSLARRPAARRRNEDAMPHPSSRRRFLQAVISGAAILRRQDLSAQQTGTIRGFDHVALPMQNSDAMVAFYRRLGLQMNETSGAVSVYVGDQMINFHRPARWQDPAFTLRAPAARPPCGDLCFVWEGTPAALKGTLDQARATFVEGPVNRPGGRRRTGSSVYVRDPDGNLLEFIIYG